MSVMITPYFAGTQDHFIFLVHHLQDVSSTLQFEKKTAFAPSILFIFWSIERRRSWSTLFISENFLEIYTLRHTPNIYLVRNKWTPRVFTMETLFQVTISLAKNLLFLILKKENEYWTTTKDHWHTILLVVNVCAFYRHWGDPPESCSWEE